MAAPERKTTNTAVAAIHTDKGESPILKRTKRNPSAGKPYRKP
jgi:hypothetical protein